MGLDAIQPPVENLKKSSQGLQVGSMFWALNRSEFKSAAGNNTASQSAREKRSMFTPFCSLRRQFARGYEKI